MHRGECVLDEETNQNHCECSSGWTGDACEIASCPENCSGNGVCVSELSPPRCVCDSGFYGDSCSKELAPLIQYGCQSSNFQPDTTLCFKGKQPEPLWPIFSSVDINEVWSAYFCGGESGECNGHGTCNGSAECECRPGFVHGSKRQCEEVICIDDGKDLCGENGFCNQDLATPQCQCDPHVTGSACEDTSFFNDLCPGQFIGDKYVECSGNGCNQGICDCPIEAGIDCSLGECEIGSNGFMCSNHGDCLFSVAGNSSWECDCAESWGGSDCSVAVCPIGENGEECSNRGVCRLDEDASNICICNAGFSGATCEASRDNGDGDDSTIIVALSISVIVLAIIITIIVIISVSVACFIRRKSLQRRLQQRSTNATVGSL
eukprot:TRINITY_DN555_c0_g1_i3.p1 TRINITY_DN555_c0_g1~~TRINITY_DN555_c0_g1_i3.p1  ORF type:complete len:377 (-),score=36.41 TRINITY_DN555_c0_g1_i3:108-1238(-)